MSELKARMLGETMNEYGCDTKIYLKFEADKVIAEKDKEIAELKGDITDLHDDKKLTDAILDERNAEIDELKKACNDKDDWCLHTLKENRHHKYKRCLTMADLCYREYQTYCALIDRGEDYSENMDFYERWHKIWLTLAEQFKEAK